MKIVVFPYSLADSKKVDQLFLELQLHEHQFDVYKTTKPENAAKYKNELLESIKHQNGELLLAKIDEKIVGLVGWYLEEEYEFDEPYGYISDIVVSKEYRGQGVGKQLLQTSLARIKATKVKRVHIGVLIGNKVTIEFYEKAGFKPYSLELTLDIQ